MALFNHDLDEQVIGCFLLYYSTRITVTASFIHQSTHRMLDAESRFQKTISASSYRIDYSTRVITNRTQRTIYQPMIPARSCRWRIPH